MNTSGRWSAHAPPRMCRALTLTFTVCMLGWATAALATTSPQDSAAYALPTATLAEAVLSGRVPADLVDTARKRREAHVMIELQLPQPYMPEHLLPATGVERQRLAIARAQDAIAAQVLGLVPKPAKRMRYVPYMSLWGDERTLTQLVRSKEVRRLQRDGTRQPDLASSTLATGIQATQRALGLLGTGQTIAIIDTGVDRTHPFFGNRVVSEACFSDDGGWFSGRDALCPNGDEEAFGVGSARPCTITGCAHGTHVAGIAAGAAFGATTFSGVADNANIIAIQVFHSENDQGDCGPGVVPPCLLADDSDVILALERVFALRGSFDIAAVNLSLGRGFFSDRATCDADNTGFRDIVSNLHGANIAAVASAGNGAAIINEQNMITGFTAGIGAPGCVSHAISVGNVDDLDAVGFDSQFSPLLTMFAPGTGIMSSVPGGGFGSKRGTSMAAPHVAGAIAVLAALDPLATAATLRNRIVNTGTAVTDNRAPVALTRPRLQLDAALESQEGRPLPPSNVARISITGSTVDIQWRDNSRSEVVFRLDARPLTAALPSRSATVNGADSTRGTITLLAPDTDYDVRVRACDALNRCSVDSLPLRVHTQNTIPSAPVSVRAGTVTTNSIELRWDSSSVNPITHFRIGNDVSGAWTSMLVPGASRAFLFSNLAASRRYEFWIQAVNADGSSARVNFGTSTLALGPPPAAPSDMHICGSRTFESACFANLTTLLWRDNATDELRYEFEWTRLQLGVPLAQAVFSTVVLPAGSRSRGLTLTSGGLYAFRVRACNAGGCSGYSNTVTHSAP